MLKGQCHAILVKRQNTKTRLCINEDQKVMLYFCCQKSLKCTEAIFLLSAAKDEGEDGDGLKLEKTVSIFSSLETVSSESCQKLNTNRSVP